MEPDGRYFLHAKPGRSGRILGRPGCCDWAKNEATCRAYSMRFVAGPPYHQHDCVVGRAPLNERHRNEYRRESGRSRYVVSSLVIRFNAASNCCAWSWLTGPVVSVTTSAPTVSSVIAT